MPSIEIAGDALGLLFFLQGIAATSTLQGVSSTYASVAGSLRILNLHFFGYRHEDEDADCSSQTLFLSNIAAVAALGLALGAFRFASATLASHATVKDDGDHPPHPAADAASSAVSLVGRLAINPFLIFPVPELCLPLATSFGLSLSSAAVLAQDCAPTWVLALACLVLVGLLGFGSLLAWVLERKVSLEAFVYNPQARVPPPGSGGGCCCPSSSSSSHREPWSDPATQEEEEGALYSESSWVDRFRFWMRALLFCCSFHCSRGGGGDGSAAAAVVVHRVGYWETGLAGAADEDEDEDDEDSKLLTLDSLWGQAPSGPGSISELAITLDIGDVMALDFDLRKCASLVGENRCGGCVWV